MSTLNFAPDPVEAGSSPTFLALSCLVSSFSLSPLRPALQLSPGWPLFHKKGITVEVVYIFSMGVLLCGLFK